MNPLLRLLPGLPLLAGCAFPTPYPGELRGCRRVVLLPVVRAERTEVLLPGREGDRWPISRSSPDPEKSAALTRLVSPREVCSMLEKKIYGRLRGRAPFRVIRSGLGVGDGVEIHDYERVAARGIDTVMEVVLSGCGMEARPIPLLFLRAKAQLLRLSDYGVLWKKGIRVSRELPSAPELERGERKCFLRAFDALAREASEKIWTGLESRLTPQRPLRGDIFRKWFRLPSRSSPE